MIDVHIASNLSDIVDKYYKNCGYDQFWRVIRIGIGKISRFSSLENLVDKINKSSEVSHIIFCHGSERDGLIMHYVDNTGHTATSQIAALSALVDDFEKNGSTYKPDSQNNTLLNAMGFMGVTANAAIKLAKKMVLIRSKKINIIIRGCNVGANSQILIDYKKAFNAGVVEAPICRMFLVNIIAYHPPKHNTIVGLGNNLMPEPKTRRRLFDPIQMSILRDIEIETAGPIVIDIKDIDGHTKIGSSSYMDVPNKATKWGIKFNGAWRGAKQNAFILPVLWDNTEQTYHTPLDFSYLMKMNFV
jgi:hypothetical protein